MVPMLVVEATDSEFATFMSLAAEVEDWFGPMVNDPGFGGAVMRNINRGSALVAVGGGGTGLGGLLLSNQRVANYEIGWLVVTEPGPEGGSRQRYQLRLQRLPAWAH